MAARKAPMSGPIAGVLKAAPTRAVRGNVLIGCFIEGEQFGLLGPLLAQGSPLSTPVRQRVVVIGQQPLRVPRLLSGSRQAYGGVSTETHPHLLVVALVSEQPGTVEPRRTLTD